MWQGRLNLVANSVLLEGQTKKGVKIGVEGFLFLALVMLVFIPGASIGMKAVLQGVKISDTIYVSVLFLCLCMMWRMIRGRIFVLEWTSIDIIITIYTFYHFGWALGDWESIDREVLWGAIASLLLYLFVRCSSKGTLNWLLFVFLFLLLLQVWYGVAVQTQYFFPGSKLKSLCGSFGNTGIWSCFVACVGIMMWGGFSFCRVWKTRCFFVMGCILCLILLYLGNSRAAWLGYIIGCIYLLFGNIRRLPVRWKWIGFVGLLVVLVVAYGLTCDKVVSARGRLFIWKIAFSMFVMRPWGWGFDGFRQHYMGFQESYFSSGGSLREKFFADETFYSFNEIIRVGVEEGVIGVLLLLFLVYCIFRKKDYSSTEEKGNACLITAVLVGWIVFALFSYPRSIFQCNALFVIFLAMQSSCRKPAFTCRLIKYFIPLFVVCLVVLGGCVRQYRHGLRVWSDCFVSGTFQGIDREALYPLRNTLHYLSNGALLFNLAGNAEAASELAFRGFNLYFSYSSGIELGIAFEQRGRYQEADIVWRRVGQMLPNRFRPLHLRMEMWWKLGNKEEAKRLAGEILKKRVKIRSPDLFYMQERAGMIYYQSTNKDL